MRNRGKQCRAQAVGFHREASAVEFRPPDSPDRSRAPPGPTRRQSRRDSCSTALDIKIPYSPHFPDERPPTRTCAPNANVDGAIGPTMMAAEMLAMRTQAGRPSCASRARMAVSYWAACGIQDVNEGCGRLELFFGRAKPSKVTR